MPEAIILPTTFNELFMVDALETNKLVKLVLLNIDVDVAFKLLIDNVELVIIHLVLRDCHIVLKHKLLLLLIIK